MVIKMKKLIILALIIFALNHIGKQNAPSYTETDDEGAKAQIKESAEIFFGQTYDGLVVCLSECKEFISDMIN